MLLQDSLGAVGTVGTVLFHLPGGSKKYRHDCPTSSAPDLYTYCAQEFLYTTASLGSKLQLHSWDSIQKATVFITQENLRTLQKPLEFTLSWVARGQRHNSMPDIMAVSPHKTPRKTSAASAVSYAGAGKMLAKLNTDFIDQPSPTQSIASSADLTFPEAPSPVHRVSEIVTPLTTSSTSDYENDVATPNGIQGAEGAVKIKESGHLSNRWADRYMRLLPDHLEISKREDTEPLKSIKIELIRFVTIKTQSSSHHSKDYIGRRLDIIVGAEQGVVCQNGDSLTSTDFVVALLLPTKWLCKWWANVIILAAEHVREGAGNGVRGDKMRLLEQADEREFRPPPPLPTHSSSLAEVDEVRQHVRVLIAKIAQWEEYCQNEEQRWVAKIQEADQEIMRLLNHKNKLLLERTGLYNEREAFAKQLLSEREAHSAKRQDIKGKFEVLKAKYLTLKQSYEKSKAREEDYRVKLEDYKSRTFQAKKTIEQTKHELDEARSDRDRSLRDMEVYKIQAESKTRELEHAQAETEELRAQLLRSSGGVAHALDTSLVQVSELRAEIRRLRESSSQEIHFSDDQIKEIHMTNKVALGELQAVGLRNKGLTELLDKADSENKVLRSKLDDVERQKFQLQEDLAMSKFDTNTLKNQLAYEGGRYHHRGDSDNVAKNLLALDDSEKVELREKLDACEQEIVQLQEDLAMSKYHRGGADDSVAKNLFLKVELLEDEKKELEAQLLKCHMEMSSM